MVKVKIKDVKTVGNTAKVIVEAEDGRGLTILCGASVASNKKTLVDLIKSHVRLMWDEEAEVE